MGGGHGSIGSLGKLEHGIEIWMRKLNKIKIAKDGQTVQMGGGLRVKEITDALWAEGKQTSKLEDAEDCATRRTGLTDIPF